MKFKLLHIFLFPLLSIAKIGDPKPLIFQGIEYKSHLNYVTATAIETKMELWKTIVFEDVEPENYNKNLEKDVQFNIINKIEFQDSILIITNSKNKKYYLLMKNGNLLHRSTYIYPNALTSLKDSINDIYVQILPNGQDIVISKGNTILYRIDLTKSCSLRPWGYENSVARHIRFQSDSVEITYAKHNAIRIDLKTGNALCLSD